MIVRAALAVLLLASPAAATKMDPPPQGADAPVMSALDLRLKRLESELRCLVCQNQTLADSNAELADDLRHEVRELAVAGKSDDEIKTYLVARYGDFVLYHPPVKPLTWMLWFGPFALMLGGGAVWVDGIAAARTRRAQRRDRRERRELGERKEGAPAARRRGRRRLEIRPAAPAQLEIRRIVLAAGAAAHAAALPAFRLQRGQDPFRALPIGGPFEPDLRLRDLGRHVADDALHVLVEDVRDDTRVLQAMQQQVRVETVEGDVEALHVRCRRSTRSSRHVAWEQCVRRCCPRQVQRTIRPAWTLPIQRIRAHRVGKLRGLADVP